MTSIAALVDELVISVHREVIDRHGERLRPLIRAWELSMPGVLIDLAEFVREDALTIDIALVRFPFWDADDVRAACRSIPTIGTLADDLGVFMATRRDAASAVWTADTTAVDVALDGAGSALAAATRPLAVAYRALATPDDPAHRLHHLLTGLRYERLAAHVAACDAAGLSRAEAVALTLAWSGDDVEQPPPGLVERGLLDGSGAITADGRTLRDDIEVSTESACEPMWAAIGALDDWVAALGVLDRLARRG